MEALSLHGFGRSRRCREPVPSSGGQPVRPRRRGPPGGAARRWNAGRLEVGKPGRIESESALGRSRELLRHLRGEAEGVAHPLEAVLLLPEDEALARQLASPRWFRTETGKVLIEDKERRRRGVRSQGRADALA